MNILYQIDNQPILQQKLYQSKQEALFCKKGQITLIQETQFGIVVNATFNSKDVVYDESYACDQSISAVFQKQINDVESLIKNHFTNKKIIEVGCGKGFFLELLQSKNYDVTGFDTTYEGTNPSIIKKYFDKNSKKYGDAIVLRHVLEHISNPVSFLNEIKIANNGKGLIYIEVPCLDWILNNSTFYDITYEHVNYFRLENFKLIFSEIIECGHTFNGQYLYIIADLNFLNKTNFKKFNEINFPDNFTQGVVKHVDKFKKENTVKSAIWGAAGKGVQYSVLMNEFLKDSGNVEIAIDLNPSKQNKYLPCSGTRVYSPSDAINLLPKGSNIIIMNPNYLNEVIDITDGIYNYFLA